MKNYKKVFNLALLGLFSFILLVLEGTAQNPKIPSDEESRKIYSAAPAKAMATPKKERKILVFTLCRGFYHNSIPYGARAVQFLGEKTKAFKTVISDDPSFFEPEKLNEFDGVCLMNALGEFFIPDNLKQLPQSEQEKILKKDRELKENFLNFIKSGKGLIVIHGSSFAFPNWKEYAEILGGFFDSHPWNGYEKLAIKIEEPAHPLVGAFCPSGFEIIDEGYQFKEPYSRKNVRVLMSLDLSNMDTNKPNLRTDRDFPITWVKQYGKGRVFHCALGHNPEEFWNPSLLTHILDGIQFAIGDLDAPVEPR
ncbi:MAG: ThuA domain-containing protein [Verrucomicrobiia bacterium]